MAAKNRLKAKKKAKPSAGKARALAKFEANFESKPSSSRSSSACSSADSSASCNSSAAQLVNEKLTPSKSASQSDLSDSSGFSSASTAEIKACDLVDSSPFASQFGQQFESPVGRFPAYKASRSCSPFSTTSSSSSSNLFVFDKNAPHFKRSPDSLSPRQSDKQSDKCSKPIANVIESDGETSAIQCDLVNARGESTRSADSISAKSQVDSLAANGPVKLFSSACRWAHSHVDYLAVLSLSVLINLNTLGAGFVYDDK